MIHIMISHPPNKTQVHIITLSQLYCKINAIPTFYESVTKIGLILS